jgi:hypothetical protein
MTAREALIEILEEECSHEGEHDILLPDRIIIALEHRGFLIVEYYRLAPEVGHA